MSVILAISH